MFLPNMNGHVSIMISWFFIVCVPDPVDEKVIG